MTTAVKTSSTYVFYNCHKCGMSLTGPDTKLRFHPRDTSLGSYNTIESVAKVIFPPPYTGTFSNHNGLKILANGENKYSSNYEGDGDFYITFQPDGSFKISRDPQHVCVPLPKLTREEMLALWQKGESFYMSDVNHEDWVWLCNQPISATITKSSASISSEKLSD